MKRLLSDPAWLRLFSLYEKAYKTVTLAFLASYSIEKKNIYNKLDFKIHFYAFGSYHCFPMHKFVKAMGLYTREEMEDPAFDALHFFRSFVFLVV